MAVQPKDDNNQPYLLLPPAQVALAVTTDDTISASTELTLNAGTQYIEVHALDKGIYLRWGTADVTSSAYDEFILANTYRAFIKPVGVTALNVIQEAATAKVRIIEK